MENNAAQRVVAALRALRRIAFVVVAGAMLCALTIRLAPIPSVFTLSLAAATSLWLIEILVGAAINRCKALPAMFAWISLFTLVLSMGTEIKCAGWQIGPGFYRLVHDWFPGFWGIRVVHRISVLFFLCFFTLSAWGLERLVKTGRMTRALYVIIVFAASLERLNSPIPWVHYEPRDSDAYDWLARQPGNGVLLELPLRTELGAYRTQYDWLRHRKPLMNGISGFVPPAYYQRVLQLESYPDGRASDLLEGILPLEFILWRREDAACLRGNPYVGLDRLPFLCKEAQFGHTTVLRVFHAFADKRPRDTFCVFADPAYLAGRALRFAVAQPEGESAHVTLDLMVGDKKVRTIDLQSERLVEISAGDLPGSGAGVKLIPASRGEQGTGQGHYEVVSDAIGESTQIWVGGRRFKPKFPDGILVVASDANGSTAMQRNLAATLDRQAEASLKAIIRRLGHRQYLFLAVSGNALSRSQSGIREAIQRHLGVDAGTGAFAFVRALRPSNTRGSPLTSTQRGVQQAVVRSAAAQFIVSDFHEIPSP
ncbi:MAG: hypothetical protein AB1714_22615 [Acidobacteriota bacterium]